MSKQINRYYTLGKIFEEPVDYDLVSDFIEQYVSIAQKKGLKPAEVIQALKNASTDLNVAIMDNCVKIQGALPSESSLTINNEWVSLPEAAKIYAVSTATIRNWINFGKPPLKHEKLSARKTNVSTTDIKRFILAPKPKR